MDYQTLEDELRAVCVAADAGAGGWVRTSRILEAIAAPTAPQAVGEPVAFTAAQAAQKLGKTQDDPEDKFTAAQAAQKVPPHWRYRSCWFTAAQAAQKTAPAATAEPSAVAGAREPLTDEQIDEEYLNGDLQPQLYDRQGMFQAGARFAERYHGIASPAGDGGAK